MTAGKVALIDGVLCPLEEAKVSVLDRGFLYGDSVFETMRTYGGLPFALGRHLARLAASAALVGIDIPVTLEALALEVTRAVVASGVEGRSGSILRWPDTRSERSSSRR